MGLRLMRNVETIKAGIGLEEGRLEAKVAEERAYRIGGEGSRRSYAIGGQSKRVKGEEGEREMNKTGGGQKSNHILVRGYASAAGMNQVFGGLTAGMGGMMPCIECQVNRGRKSVWTLVSSEKLVSRRTTFIKLLQYNKL